jgi:hypothetical protein
MIRSASSTATRAARSAHAPASGRMWSASRNNASRWSHTTQKTSSARTKSTLALESNAKLAAATAASKSTTTPLSKDQIRSIFLSAAIPMVGFGFMDNFIMITAGSAIDSTLGVQMGLATMTAAAIGQVVSDVSGVIFGDTLSRVFQIEPAKLTKVQKRLKSVARLRLGGAVLGVILGCTLGATALQLIPDEPRKEEASVGTSSALSTGSTSSSASMPNDQLQQRHQLPVRNQLHRIQKVMEDVMTSDEETWHEKLASCTLYVNGLEGEHCLPPPLKRRSSITRQSLSTLFGSPQQHTHIATIARLNMNNNNKKDADPEVLHTLRERRVVVFADTIYVPIQMQTNSEEEEEVLGIFKVKLENGSFYTGSEIKDAKRVARNLGYFLHRMVE